MPSRGRTIVYIDNSNVFKAQKRAGWRIDVEKLMKALGKDGEIWQTYFFAAVSDPPKYQQTNFYRMLKEKLHWETIILPLGTKTVTCMSCGDSRRLMTEKGVDVALATKILTHAINRAFDTAILVAGDKDYLETVKAVKGFGLRVEVVSFRGSLSRDLANESSAPAFYLDDHRAELELLQPDVEAEDLLPADGEA
jgi:uncharacterized LabA/DUF88 family protein